MAIRVGLIGFWFVWAEVFHATFVMNRPAGNDDRRNVLQFQRRVK